MIGLGTQDALINVYIEHTPPLPQYQSLRSINPIKSKDIYNIAELTGNHWRKIFNVYAKLIFELDNTHFDSWQQLRDDYLLQEHSNYNLVFSEPVRTELSPQQIHIVMGKTYATRLGFADCTYWVKPYLSINEQENIIVCPYFDYRQLSDIKIKELAALIKPLRHLALRIPAKQICA